MSAHSSATSISAMAAATPSSRDRYVDFLRAFSIAVVVFGHWLLAIIYFDGAKLSGTSALDVVPWAWLGTWLLQVMPLFFFVGGFSNLTSWRANERRGGNYFDFISGRVERLMRPAGVFIAFWLGTAIILEIAVPSTAARLQLALAGIARPLWFIAVYLVVVGLAPAMLQLHERYRAFVPIGMIAAAAVVDFLGIALELPIVGYLNFAFVWLFAHQMGFFYADGTLTAWSRRRMAAMTLLGLSALVALTALGPYSPSMVGVADGRVSNNDPPTVCIIALSIWLIGIAMLGRERITRVLQRRRAWSAVIAANSIIMTVFLWHLTALLVGVVALYPLGFPQPVGGSAEWWLMRPVWLALLLALLVPFVAVFSRYERPRIKTQRKVGERSFVQAAAGLASMSGGIAGFATAGFSHALLVSGPLQNAAFVAVGMALLKTSRDKGDRLP